MTSKSDSQDRTPPARAQEHIHTLTQPPLHIYLVVAGKRPSTGLARLARRPHLHRNNDDNQAEATSRGNCYPTSFLSSSNTEAIDSGPDVGVGETISDLMGRAIHDDSANFRVQNGSLQHESDGLHQHGQEQAQSFFAYRAQYSNHLPPKAGSTSSYTVESTNDRPFKGGDIVQIGTRKATANITNSHEALSAPRGPGDRIITRDGTAVDVDLTWAIVWRLNGNALVVVPLEIYNDTERQRVPLIEVWDEIGGRYRLRSYLQVVRDDGEGPLEPEGKCFLEGAAPLTWHAVEGSTVPQQRDAFAILDKTQFRHYEPGHWFRKAEAPESDSWEALKKHVAFVSADEDSAMRRY